MARQYSRDVGTGIYRDVETECTQTIRVSDEIKPFQDSCIYATHYPIYRELYPALAPYFKQISKPEGE